MKKTKTKVTDQIQRFQLRSMSNSLYWQFMKDSDYEFNRVGLKALRISKVYERYKEGLKLMGDTFAAQRVNNLTVIMDEKDRLRLREYRRFRLHVLAEKMSNDETDLENARKLINKIDAYGTMSKYGCAVRSANMTDLTDDMGVAPYKDWVAHFGLTDNVAKMKAANDAFIEVSRERMQEDRDDSPTYKEARKVMDKAFNDVVEVINSQSRLQSLADEETEGEEEPDLPSVQSRNVDNDPIRDIILSINAIIKTYKTKVAQSGSDKPKDKNTSDKPNNSTDKDKEENKKPETNTDNNTSNTQKPEENTGGNTSETDKPTTDTGNTGSETDKPEGETPSEGSEEQKPTEEDRPVVQ